MTNLFADLYRYRQRPNRNPKEDYLTEVFKHLMNELNESDKGWSSRVLKELLNLKDCADTIKVKWSSQCYIPDAGIMHGKRPDLICEGNGVFVIVENKISAGFTFHLDQDEPRTEYALKNQLDIYQIYLDNRKEKFRRIVLISHETDPPDKFEGTIVHWSHIHLRIKQWISRDELEGLPKAKFIAQSLISLLEEWDMGSINLKSSDVDVSLETFFAVYRASEQFGAIASKVVLQELTEQYLGTNKRIGITWKELSPMVPPKFFGIVLSKCNQSGSPEVPETSPVLIWAGALLGDCYGAIRPQCAGIADLTVGIGVWYSRLKRLDDFNTRVDAICKQLGSKWQKMEESNQNNPEEDVVIISTNCSYRQALQYLQNEQRDGLLDWATFARDFFSKNFQAIMSLTDEQIDSIADLLGTEVLK